MSVVVGRSPEEEEELIKALSLAVQQPQRKLFTLLTSDDVLAKVPQICFKLFPLVGPVVLMCRSLLFIFAYS